MVNKLKEETCVSTPPQGGAFRYMLAATEPKKGGFSEISLIFNTESQLIFTTKGREGGNTS